MPQTWSPDTYARHAAFVPALGQSILARLAPQPGERVLDLGCGDGTLTERIAASGASVVGVDGSAAMIAAAVSRGLGAWQMDARALAFDEAFDAVFSNAVLHWIPEAGLVVDGIRRALVPGGRFVAEFGGHGNIAAIATAIRAVLERHGLPNDSPWFYPTPAEYRAILEAHGFEVRFIALVPRPTPLPTGMEGWLATFRGPLLETYGPVMRTRIVAEIIALLEPSLCDTQGNWTADYIRLQVEARKKGG